MFWRSFLDADKSVNARLLSWNMSFSINSKTFCIEARALPNAFLSYNSQFAAFPIQASKPYSDTLAAVSGQISKLVSRAIAPPIREG